LTTRKEGKRYRNAIPQNLTKKREKRLRKGEFQGTNGFENKKYGPIPGGEKMEEHVVASRGD